MISEIMYQSFTDLGVPEDFREEFIELYNRGDATADLAGWRLDDGIQFDFPAATLAPGEYLVVTADPATFHAVHPAVTNYIATGGWDGHLSNSGERIALVDQNGVVADQVEYSDEGDWSVREKVRYPQFSYNFGSGTEYNEGLAWANAHDGSGKSLELINPAMTNNIGQNWGASIPDGGTPGAANSIADSDIAPLITAVEHDPAIPRSSDPITVRAETRDELAGGVSVTLHYREDGDPDFNTLAMYDDGLHDDEWPGDGVFGATIAPGTFANGVIVEFYVGASDAGANARTWPAPVVPVAPITVGGQIANCLLQIDDSFDPGATRPPGTPTEFRVITTAAEWAYFQKWADVSGSTFKPDGLVNATLIAVDGVGTEVRYEVGLRNRGNGSRAHNPHNLRFNLPHDRPYQGYKSININAQRPYAQALGSAVFRYADIPTADGVQVRIVTNGVDRADVGTDMYGYYIWLEAMDTELVENHWPDDNAGNFYKCNYYLPGGRTDATLEYLGDDPDLYRNEYNKQTNVSADDFSDLIHMLDVLNNNPDATFWEEVNQVIDVRQWLRYMGVNTLLGSTEGSLITGDGDDYALYAGVVDPRFQLMPYDLDSIVTWGSGATNRDIWSYRSTDLPGLYRLLNDPHVPQIYYEELLDLCDTVFAPETINPLVDQVLGGWRDAGTRNGVKDWIVTRVANVRGQIPQNGLSVQSGLPINGGYPYTTNDLVGLSGTAPAAQTKSVLVDGQEAEWNAENGTWLVGTGSASGTQLVFQNDVSPNASYAGTADTEIRYSNLTGNLGAATSINVDGSDAGGAVHGLIRFDNIFGTGPGQVAPGAPIATATLTLQVSNSGNTMRLHQMLMPWSEAANWNTFGGNGIQGNDIEATSTYVSTPAPGGTLNVDVTAAIQAWQADPSSNLGWAIIPTGSDGMDFYSSESTTLPNRPRLTITLDDAEPMGVPLTQPGLSRVVVQAFDGENGTGNKIDETFVDIWHNVGRVNIYPNSLPSLTTNLIVPDSYLPGQPVLVRVEVRDQFGEIYRELWDATASLSADAGVAMDVSQITMFNGLGSALVTFTGSGPFNLTADVEGFQDSDDLSDLSGAPVTTVSGTLADPSGTDTWSGVIHVTGDVLVPAGHTLLIQPGTLIRVDGVASGSGGMDIDVVGEIQSLGTEDSPITFTAYNAAQAWGEIHHNGAAPSLYQYTNIIRAGNSPGGGHTGSGPAFRPTGSVIVFENVNITDNAGKVMQSTGGSDLTFRDCVLARSVMGPEIDNTALLFENSWITENHGPNDDDGIYIHSQAAGQDCTLRGGVIADTDDDGLDTLHATVLVENYIFRDIFDKGISVYGGEVTLNNIISVNNDIGISAKDESHAVVHMDHVTISGNRLGIQAENKGGGMDNGVVEYFVTNSIVYGNSEYAVRSHYPLDPIRFDHSIVGGSWVHNREYYPPPDNTPIVWTGEIWAGVANANTDPLFVNPALRDFHLQTGSPAIGADEGGGDMGAYPAAVTAGDGELLGDTVWRPQNGQYRVASQLTVPAGSTLTIMPGTTVFFDDGASLLVEGRLDAQGTPDALIHFTRSPGATSWNGIRFNNTMADNRITYAVAQYSTRVDGMIELDASNLLIDHVTLDHADRRRIRADNSSLIVRNSTFTDFVFAAPPNNVAEHIYGADVAPGGHFIVENNVFGLTPGHNDAIDFNAGHRAAGDPVPQILDNVFLGGGDDALDVEGDFHVEGNLFMHYRKDAAHDAVDGGESNVISAGDAHDVGHEYVVTRNIFYDVDHVALVKEHSFMTFTNNTVVQVDQGPYAAVAGALNFDLVGQTNLPGDGAYLDGNIFAATPLVFNNVDSRGTITDLVVNRSILPAAEHRGGLGNIDAEARLADPAGGDFSLSGASPARGTGPVGRDMGAGVPAGALISPVSASQTYKTGATFQVAAYDYPDHSPIFAYKYRLNGGAWSGQRTPGTPISLTGLSNGAQLLEVIAQNSAGAWQDPADATTATWTVNTSLSRVLINEILAINATTYEHQATYPDVIELYNDSPTAVNLSDWGISDAPLNPLDPTDEPKYIFPAGTTIPAEGYLVLYADDVTTPPMPGIHLGFQLDGAGEGVYLYNAGGAVVDSVAFGVQVADLSIGRVGADRAWSLTRPTIDPTGAAAANVAQPTGEADRVVINEWFTNGDVVLLEDFIELYNPDTVAVNLAGLYLTDNPANQKTKQQIPPLSFIGARGFQELKADGQDQSGHVDFRLDAKMEILGLFDADLVQLDRIYYGSQTEDVSQGRTPDGSDTIAFFTLPTPAVANQAGASATRTLVAESDGKYVLVPTGDIGTTWRSNLGFNTTGWGYWNGTPTGVGYDSGDGGYLGLIGWNTETHGDMDDTNATCYIRIPFTFDGDPGEISSLSLNVRYDDGFIAYLNGREIRRETFAPGDTPAWNSPANGTHDDGLAVGLVSFDVSQFIGELNTGANLLAIHGLNETPSSSDFLISAELVATTSSPLLSLHDNLRITELMYNPPGSDSIEFIELQNTGTTPIDLTGARFTAGVDFVFPAMTLASGEYVVVARDLAAFEAWYGTGINAIGNYDPDALSNSGEEIVLRMPAPYEAAILRFEYSDNWYPSTDGDGPSLVINDPLGHRAAWQEKSGWHAGSVAGGSPGAADAMAEMPVGAVVINEVLAHSDDPARGDWIELHNTTAADIDISGWFLSDDIGQPQKFVIPGDPGTPFAPGNTILPAGGYLVFNQVEHFGVGSGHPGSLIGFGLSEHGDEVILSSADVAGNLGTYREFVTFGATDNSVTLGRYTTGTGSVDFVAMQEPHPDPEPEPYRPGTYGYANAGPLVGPVVFEEIMYRPVVGGNEYLLLRNISAAPVALYDPANPTNTWHVTGGTEFVFPEGVVVPADGYVLVTDVDTATYLASHTVPDGVAVFGPFVGALSNAGERLTLQKPGTPETLPEPFVPYITAESVQYDDEFPWPEEPDGAGPALSRLVGSAYSSDPTNWGSSGAPLVTVDPLTTEDTSPPLTGTATDAHPPASVIVTVNAVQYTADVVGGVWNLPDDTISPPLAAGTYDVVVTAVDLAGNLGSDATTGELVVIAPGVVGRHVFYNRSAFDGNNAGADAADDAAIAADKQALLPGHVATFSNYTSFSQGLNGVMVDLEGLPEGYTPVETDFRFYVGYSNAPGSWAAAPAPEIVDFRPGAGVDGSDRVTIIWADNAIRQQWLQVTVVKDNLGLPIDDVFYFGNAVAETGNSDLNAQVTTIDLLLARNNPRNFLDPPPIDFAYDFNRDQRVNATDVLLARNNQTSFVNALRLIDLSEQASPALAVESPLPAMEPEISLDDADWLLAYEQVSRQDRTPKNRDHSEEAVDKLLATYWP
ncbi:MAG TPA: lamin tail domain-containing protein [Thermoguttaceae bacterium]|nr:lamin tail domain-containing protein [Thermoguttaceae bacterium]